MKMNMFYQDIANDRIAPDAQQMHDHSLYCLQSIELALVTFWIGVRRMDKTTRNNEAMYEQIDIIM